MIRRKNIARNLRKLMPSIASNPLIQLTNKIRRFFLCAVNEDYVQQQVENRGGECVGCGRCCKLVFRCPFLGGTEDNPRCMVYDDRPKPCQAFPIDNRDLADVNFQCGYFFPSAGLIPQLVQIQLPVPREINIYQKVIPQQANQESPTIPDLCQTSN